MTVVFQTNVPSQNRLPVRSARHMIAIATVIGLVTLCMSSTRALATYDTIYHYDAYGRLIEVDYPDGSSITYTYDAAGNRATLAQTAAPG